MLVQGHAHTPGALKLTLVAVAWSVGEGVRECLTVTKGHVQASWVAFYLLRERLSRPFTEAWELGSPQGPSGSWRPGLTLPKSSLQPRAQGGPAKEVFMIKR